MDQLFEDLQKASSATERQSLVCNALQAGMAQNDVREMLDYLESCGSQLCSPKDRSSSPGAEGKTRSNGGWGAFFNGLICRYR